MEQNILKELCDTHESVMTLGNVFNGELTMCGELGHKVTDWMSGFRRRGSIL